MIKRFLLPAIFATLAAAALLVHLPSTAESPTPMQRGSYAILLDAEQSLASAQLGQAIDQFHFAWNRAGAEGQPNMAERIRWRMGSAGKELLAKDDNVAWPFFAAYALLSDDFTRDAQAVENMVLTGGHNASGTFEYPLTLDDGRSFWGTVPDVDWRGLWSSQSSWKGLFSQARLGGPLADAKLELPSASYVLFLRFEMRARNNIPLETQLSVKVPDAVGGACWVRQGRDIEVCEADGNGGWQGQVMSKRGQVPSWVILFSDNAPAHAKLTVSLLRQYQTLY